MLEKISLDMLNKDSVSVKKQKYVVDEGVEYSVGKPWRKAYINSESGRQQVINELPQEHQNAIFAIWGDAPTVDNKK